jgi:glycosyltransferase involved in cell wall biosynthesis
MYLIAGWMQGEALSGGDRIFIELAKRWQLKIKVKLFLSEEGVTICNRHGLENFEIHTWASKKYSQLGYLRDYLYRTWVGLSACRHLKPSASDIVFSSSDFAPDALPAFLVKLRNPQVVWIAGFFLFAPKPWQKDSPYKGKQWLTGMFYWLSQRPVYYLIKKYADIVFVTSDPDISKFITSKRGKDKVVVIRGGVDTRPSEEYLSSGKCIPLEERKYDACFVGRFHYQKGILELIDIWSLVCKYKPDAKLGIIGVGPLEKEVQDKIKKLGLISKIDLLGFRIGAAKYDVFMDSKIVVHPATYDSGGMAAAEAMAWGLPSVGFDLEALKTYYPKGMLKTKCFDHKEFSKNILELLENSDRYKEISQEAHSLIREKWEWDSQAQAIYGAAIAESEGKNHLTS